MRPGHPSGSLCAGRPRRVSGNSRDPAGLEEVVRGGFEPRCVPGLQNNVAEHAAAERRQEAIRLDQRKGSDFGGSWIKTGPSLSRRPAISDRNVSRLGDTSRQSEWLTDFGAFTEKRKWSGTDALHRS